MGKWIEKAISKEDDQMSDKYMKQWLIFLAIK
jgi:hypothetical protein